MACTKHCTCKIRKKISTCPKTVLVPVLKKAVFRIRDFLIQIRDLRIRITGRDPDPDLSLSDFQDVNKKYKDNKLLKSHKTV